MLVVGKAVVIVLVVALLVVRLLVQRRRARSATPAKVNVPLTVLCGVAVVVLLFVPLPR